MAQTHTHTLSYTDTIHTLQCANVIDRQNTPHRQTDRLREKEKRRKKVELTCTYTHIIIIKSFNYKENNYNEKEGADRRTRLVRACHHKLKKITRTDRHHSTVRHNTRHSWLPSILLYGT